MNKLLLPLFAALVACVTTSSAFAQEVKGDAKEGEKKIALCIGCLNAYKKGERKHPTMRGIADALSDQDIADIAAHYESSGTVAGAPALAKAADGSPKAMELVAKGACASCHGESFSKPIDPTYPKIAGQHSDYLFVALKAYKTDSNPMIGRGNAIMGGIAKQFTNAELKELAGYMGSLPGELKTVPQNKFK